MYAANPPARAIASGDADAGDPAAKAASTAAGTITDADGRGGQPTPEHDLPGRRR